MWSRALDDPWIEIHWALSQELFSTGPFVEVSRGAMGDHVSLFIFRYHGGLFMIRLFFCVLALVACFPVLSQGQELLLNGSFDESIDDWISGFPLTLSHTGSEGSENLGAADLFGIQNAGPFSNMTQCVTADRLEGAVGRFLAVAAAAKPSNHPVTVLDMTFRYYADVCEGEFIGFDNVQTPMIADQWNHAAGQVGPVPAETQELTLTLSMSTANQVQVTNFFDDVSLSVLPNIFQDGFETGDTSAWSLAIP